MGATFEIDSLEEMCDLMCDNTPPKPKRIWWIFTFGSGQRNAGKYVKIKGTYLEARQTMLERYGSEWGFQYSEDEWERMANDPNRGWAMETELEVIE